MKRAMAIVLCCFLVACDNDDSTRQYAEEITGGRIEQGRVAIQKYGCGSCHTIPGIIGAHGMVGPNLSGIARRMYIGGVIENNAPNMIHWIQDPPAIDSKTAMPKLGVTPAEAQHIAAYLYTLDDK